MTQIHNGQTKSDKNNDIINVTSLKTILNHQ